MIQLLDHVLQRLVVHELVLDHHRDDRVSLARPAGVGQGLGQLPADAVPILEDRCDLGPVPPGRVGVDADRVDAALEEPVEVRPEGRAAQVVPGEGGQVAEVEDERMAQGDRLLPPRLLGEETEQAVGSSPRRLEVLEGHERLRSADAKRQAGSVIHRSRARPVPRETACERLARVLARELGPDLLALGERHRDVRRGHARPHGSQGAQAHLDPLPIGVVEGAVLEVRGVEGRAEAGVQDPQDVEVELGGDAGGVVVGRVEALLVLDEVDADEEGVPGHEREGGRAKERRQAVRVQVAHGAREEEQEAAASGAQRPEVVLEVAGDPARRRPPGSPRAAGPPTRAGRAR